MYGALVGHKLKQCALLGFSSVPHAGFETVAQAVSRPETEGAQQLDPFLRDPALPGGGIGDGGEVRERCARSRC